MADSNLGWTSKIKQRKKWVITAVIIILVLGGFGIWRARAKNTAQTRYLTEQVSKQTIVSSVTGTGQIIASNQVDINPQGSGQVTTVYVKPGDAAKAGQTLAALDETNALNQIRSAKAALASAQANYDNVLAGATSQDVQLAQLAVQSAQQNLDNAKTAYDQTKAQQQLAVQKAFTAMMNSTLTAAPAPGNFSTLIPTITGAYTGTQQGQYVIHLYDSGSGLHFTTTGLENWDGLVNTNNPVALGSEGLYIQFPTGKLYTSDYWTVSIPNTAASDYWSNYNAYQTALQTQTQALQQAQQQIDSASNALQQAQTQLSAKQAPPTQAQVESAQSQITAAQATLASAQTAYDNNIIKAPFDGVIATVNLKVGQQAGASTAAFTEVTQQEIAQVSLNEVDVAKVKLGQQATLTFDAIDGLTLTGHVAQIDTIGTVTQGVVNYNVQIALDTQNGQIKPGMSVTASIITATKADVLAVPNSAVKSSGSQSYVQVLDNPGPTVAGQQGVTSVTPPRQVPVQTGISDDSYTEIISGLTEGQSVVTQTISSSASTNTASSNSGNGLRIPGITTGGGGFRAGGGGGNAVIIGR